MTIADGTTARMAAAKDGYAAPHRQGICGEETEVYSRVTGYFRPVKNWNRGKREEFKDRKVYTGQGGQTNEERAIS